MKLLYPHIARVTFLAIVVIAATACGGGGSSTPPPPPTEFTISGTVTGLDAGQSVVLQDNGRDNVTVANGPFTFVTKVMSGSAYAVTVSPPSGKTCTVTGGSGTASSNVTSVAVLCVSNQTVSIGGSVSGLVGQGLYLELRTQGHTLVASIFLQGRGISGNGDFVFPTPVASDQNSVRVGYFVRVAQQPVSPSQRCVVRNQPVVTAGTNVTDISIVCGEFEFAYATNVADNTISAFSIDATTGAIASVGPSVTAGLSPSAIAGTSDKSYLYVSNRGSNDVSAFAVDAGSGALSTVPGSPFAAGTSPRAVSVFASRSCTSRGRICFVDSYLYVANAGSDNVSAYSVDPSTGVPTPLTPASHATGTGPSAMAIHPTAGLLYTANTGGSDDISAFMIDFTTGGLTPIAGSPFRSGSSVSSLAFGGSVNTYPLFLYAANASGGTAVIYGFAITPSVNQFGPDPNGGALTSLAGFPYPLPSCTFIVTDQTHTHLYATAGTNLFGFSTDQQTGALSPLSGFPVAIGVNATSVSIDPTNQFLYVANGSAGTVTGFELNAATGALTPMSGSPFAVGKPADFIATF